MAASPVCQPSTGYCATGSPTCLCRAMEGPMNQQARNAPALPETPGEGIPLAAIRAGRS